jgi:hypothetical protein
MGFAQQCGLVGSVQICVFGDGVPVSLASDGPIPLDSQPGSALGEKHLVYRDLQISEILEIVKAFLSFWISSFDPFHTSYCTITVRTVLWFRLPDLAVTVAAYVPAGVAGVVVGDDEPPPHAAMPKNTTAIIGIARAGFRRL